MLLRNGGIDIFYIDESHDQNDYVVTAIAVPFLRQNDGIWNISWVDHHAGAKQWRNKIQSDLKIPIKKELHGTKLISGRGNFLYGTRQLQPIDGVNYYKQILSWLNFLPEASIMSVSGGRSMNLYGNTRLERVMFALFQRMRLQCDARNVNAMVFFDQGHSEYRKLYRKSMVYLPTGSSFGNWGGGDNNRNMPLDMFIKDANEKNSKLCLFTQLADLVAYAALMKVKHQQNRLSDKQRELELHEIYNSIPTQMLNIRASRTSRDGIARI